MWGYRNLIWIAYLTIVFYLYKVGIIHKYNEWLLPKKNHDHMWHWFGINPRNIYVKVNMIICIRNQITRTQLYWQKKIIQDRFPISMQRRVYNACSSKLFFIIMMFLKINNKQTRALVCDVYGMIMELWHDNTFLDILSRSFIRMFNCIVIYQQFEFQQFQIDYQLAYIMHWYNLPHPMFLSIT